MARQNQGGEFGTVPGLRESPTWVLEPLLLAKEPLRQGRDVEGTSRDPESLSVGTQDWDPRNCLARWNWKRRHRLDSSQGSLATAWPEWPPRIPQGPLWLEETSEPGESFTQ